MSQKKNLYQQIEDLATKEELTNVERSLILEKAFKSSDPNVILRARRYVEGFTNESKDAPKSILIDPIDLYNGLGFKETPLKTTYNVLRRTARVPIVRSVIETRKDQVAAFSTPVDDEQKMGWMVRKKKKLFVDQKEPTKQERQKQEDLMMFILNAGIKTNKWKRVDFDSFLRQCTKDSLELDQMTFEVIRNRKGELLEFFPTDGGTYRIIGDYTNPNDPRNKDKEAINDCFPAYLQLYQNMPYAEFYPWELCFGTRNRSTQLEQNGYGVSELEDLIRVVTYLIYSEEYNGRFFSQGSNPKGILKVSSSISDASLQQFKMEWMSMMAGVQGYHRIPVLRDKELEWIDMQKTNNDMQFTKWQMWLIQAICALYKIAPEEIGFITEGQGGAKMFGEGSKTKLDWSREKGLVPLLKFMEGQINKYIVSEIDEDYEFIFCGITPEDDQQVLDDDIKKVGSFETLNEVRQRKGLPPLENGDMPLNSVYLQAKNASMMGNPDSNAAVDQSQYAENPFNMGSEGDQTQKAIDDNPILKDLERFIETEMS